MSDKKAPVIWRIFQALVALGLFWSWVRFIYSAEWNEIVTAISHAMTWNNVVVYLGAFVVSSAIVLAMAFTLIGVAIRGRPRTILTLLGFLLVASEIYQTFWPPQ
jgi:hypothetical protein